jgi:glycosyltransferase involved in cell wall biosynthesis
VAVCNSEDYVAEALTAILSQIRPADEVIVVDDGSTDGTQRELAPFRSEIRIVTQSNHGHPGAYNRGFAEARGDYVARCDADDVWEPDKLERQVAALVKHPAIDIAAGAAWFFDRAEGLFAAPPGDGLLEIRSFARKLYRANWLCASSTLIRRRLFEQIGPFMQRLACEDYDFWLGAAGTGAVFFSDPAIVVRYRRHAGNVSNDQLGMSRAVRFVHLRHADLPQDRRLVSQVLAEDRSRVGRLLVEENAREARGEFVGALRHRLAPRELAWAVVLSMPDRYQRALIPSLVSTARELSAWSPALCGALAVHESPSSPEPRPRAPYRCPPRKRDQAGGCDFPEWAA